MNLAVLKYQFVTNKPEGIPDSWPAETIELGNSTELPGENWVLMTKEEFDSHVADNKSDYDSWYFSNIQLEEKKRSRIIQIDIRTQCIIAEGFTFDSHQFSLSIPAQINWSGILLFKDLLSWPMNVTTLDDQEYSLTMDNLLYFMGSGTSVIKNAVDSGRALKLQVRAATSQAELDDVVDDR